MATAILTPLRAQLHGTLDAIALLDTAAGAANEAWCDDDTAAEDDTTHPLYLAWQTAEHATEFLRASVDVLRVALAASDEPRPWRLIEDVEYCPDHMAGSVAEAITEARDNVARANYPIDDEDGPGGTIWIDVRVVCDETDEEGSDTVQIDAPEPTCEGGDAHEWQSPHEVVGGVEENPGVHGHGGGVIVRAVCAHCGIYRVTDTWAQRRDTGEQGLDSVAYAPADDESLAWVDSLRETEEA